MSPIKTMHISMPEDIQKAASQIIREAGFTVDEIVYGLMRKIARESSVPPEFSKTDNPHEEFDETIRKQAIESIKERRKNRLKPAATIEEIIAWRNEGRK